MSDFDEALEVGWSHYKNGNYINAIAELQKASIDGPQAAFANFRMGCCYRSLGIRSLALDHFANAVSLDPNQAHYHRELGRQVAFCGSPIGALEHFATSLELDPLVPLTYHEIGACLSFLGNAELALFSYTICAVLCDCAPADYKTDVSFTLLTRSMLNIKTFRSGCINHRFYSFQLNICAKPIARVETLVA
jgi:hypothetical protein